MPVKRCWQQVAAAVVSSGALVARPNSLRAAAAAARLTLSPVRVCRQRLRVGDGVGA